jgi:urease accessory protein
MLVANRCIRKQENTAKAPFDRITLDSGARHLRRSRLTTDAGEAVLVDLPEACFLQGGDLLSCEGRLIEVVAAPEPLLEITAHDALAFSRLTWHLGNRHTAAEITNEAIYIQPDHVLQHLAETLGAKVKPVTRAFHPEMGAYHGHGH